MAGSTFGRLKTWDDEVLTNEDLNDEIDNILENLGAIGVGGYSASVAQMQLQTSPGIAGSESLAASIAGELERIRYVLAQIKGSALWYDPINNSLATISESLETTLSSNRVESGKIRSESSQPIYLKPHGTNLTVSVQGSVTPLIFYVNNELVEIDSDVDSPTLLAAPTTDNTASVNDGGIDDGEHTKYIGEFGTSLFIDSAGTEITTRVGQLAAFSIDNGVTVEYFIARIKSSTELTEVKRGFFFNSSDAPVPRIAINDNDVITLLRLTWVFAKNDGTLTFTYNEPIFSAVQPASPSAGDYWFDLVNSQWKVFDAVQFVAANAMFVGRCAQNTTSCVVARSADFSKAYSDVNSVELSLFDATQVRAKFDNAMLSVYGSAVQFGNYLPRWDMDLHLDSGVTEAADTIYFLYVNETGKTIISNQCPADRRGDLRGYYHPHHAWRCVGQFHNDASQDAEAVIAYSDADDINYVLTQKVASNALTLKVHSIPGKLLKFKSAVAGDGEWQDGAILPGTQLVIASGSTLGTTSGVQENLWAHLILFGGRAELAISKFLCGAGSLVTSTAEAGNGDLDTALYSFVARSNVSVLPLAELQNEQTTAGTWAAALEAIRLFPFGLGGKIRFRVYTSNATWTKPADLKAVFAGITAGGGGGGGVAGTGTNAGGGGGSGGTALKYIPADLLNATESVTIGAAGTAGSGTSGGTGGASSFGSHITTTGGGGGQLANAISPNSMAGTGGSSGTASSGLLNIAGGYGFAGAPNVATTPANIGGNGGGSFWGGGGRGGADTSGAAGVSYGSGGGGAGNAGIGGAGAAGIGFVIEIYN